MPPPPPAAPPAHAPAAGALPAAMGEPPPAPLALPPQWAGLPYVHKHGRIDLEATRFRLTAMMLRLGLGEDQVAGLDCDALWTRITGHHNRDALVNGGKKWEKIINPPLSGREAARVVLVAWDFGATPPMWTSVDPTRRAKRAQDKLEQAEQRKKRRVPPAPAAPAAPAATRPVGLSDEERDAFDVAFPEGVWPERARHMLPFLVKTTRIAQDKELMMAAIQGEGEDELDEAWDAAESRGERAPLLIEFACPELQRDDDIVCATLTGVEASYRDDCWVDTVKTYMTSAQQDSVDFAIRTVKASTASWVAFSARVQMDPRVLNIVIADSSWWQELDDSPLRRKLVKIAGRLSAANRA